jgi:uncharacterized phage protein (TIGR01671 family)
MDYIDLPEINKLEFAYISNMPIMQYTGLKDKNGKEIYEQDILKNIDLNGIVFVMEWVKNSYGLVDRNNKYITGIYSNKCKIIGNIYENPEILEAK